MDQTIKELLKKVEQLDVTVKELRERNAELTFQAELKEIDNKYIKMQLENLKSNSDEFFKHLGEIYKLI